MDKLKRFKILEKEIKRHDRDYYQYDNPTISDANYDKLRSELELLRSEIGENNVQTDLFSRVGAPILSGFSKIQHKKPMLSLSNAFNKEDIIDFIDRIKRFLSIANEDFAQSGINLSGINLFCEPKIDGLSFCVTYKDGKLLHGATRGDGVIGEDITENIKTIKDFPLTLPINDLIEIRGEVYMSKDDFIALNKINKRLVVKFLLILETQLLDPCVNLTAISQKSVI